MICNAAVPLPVSGGSISSTVLVYSILLQHTWLQFPSQAEGFNHLVYVILFRAGLSRPLTTVIFQLLVSKHV